LPLIGKVTEEVSLLVDINMKSPQFAYFNGNVFFESMAPVINSLYSPFMLKNVLFYLLRVDVMNFSSNYCKTIETYST
jgi:hypothetical protein